MKPAKYQRGIAHIPLMLIIVLVAVGGIAVGRSSILNKFKVDFSDENEAVSKTEEKEIDEVKVEEKEEKESPEIEIKKEPEKEKIIEEKKETVSTGISLTSKAQDKGVHLYWTVNGISINNGFKIVKSTNSNPTFPEDGYIYVSDSSVKNYFLGLKDGKTWYIRVCKYNGSGSCDYYSNEIVFKAPDLGGGKSDDSDSNVDNIDLGVTKKSGDKVKLTWSVDGKAKKGFKVVWSKNDKPTYPPGDGDKYHYLSNPDTRSDYIDDLDDNKKYYFRVCEYLGGKCGTYSNQVSIEL